MQLSLALCLVCLLVHAAFRAAEAQGWQAFKNDATEIIPELGEFPEPPPELENNKTMNRAENGGRPPHHPFETKGMGWERALAAQAPLRGGLSLGLLKLGWSLRCCWPWVEGQSCLEQGRIACQWRPGI